ncbi:uncharacterized protein LOC142532307 [Primulina tabacum]|uniref:uncharacterized protein LOC142532307 n=1 Tax=Primulina tabacum TaxID=48773 RepID=UPI003F5A4B62
MRTAQSRQKSYADKRRRDLEFAVGDHVFVKVAPMKGVMRFGKKGKLSPRFIGPFEILDRVGTLAYRVALPPNLAGVHNVFHVSMLRKYMANPSHVLNFEPLQLTPNLSYEERPVQILDRQEKKLRNKLVKRVKVKWLNHSEEEATWESESEMRERYPELFDALSRKHAAIAHLSVQRPLNTYTMSQYAELYIREIVRLHGIPVSDKVPSFTSAFLKSLHHALGTKLLFGTAFRTQTDGQLESLIHF